LTNTGRSATTIVPVRAGPTFALTVKLTVPEPIPPLLATESHGSRVSTVHSQSGDVSTVNMLPAPPAAAADCVDGVTAYSQRGGGGNPACVSDHD
jgi:hypothetical protein